jgi:hypothetical protein
MHLNRDNFNAGPLFERKTYVFSSVVLLTVLWCRKLGLKEIKSGSGCSFLSVEL